MLINVLIKLMQEHIQLGKQNVRLSVIGFKVMQVTLMLVLLALESASVQVIQIAMII